MSHRFRFEITAQLNPTERLIDEFDGPPWDDGWQLLENLTNEIEASSPSTIYAGDDGEYDVTDWSVVDSSTTWDAQSGQHPTVTLVVEAELERTQGHFASRDDLEQELVSEIEQLEPSEIATEHFEWETDCFAVAAAPVPKPKKIRRPKVG